MANVTCKVIKEYGTIRTDGEYSIKVCLVQWGQYQPKLEIRKWKKTADGEKALAGLTFVDDEVRAVIDALQQALKEKEVV